MSSPQSVPSTREPKRTRIHTPETTTRPTTSKWISRRRTNTHARRLCTTGRVKTLWNRGRRENYRERTSSPYELGQQVESVATPPSQVPFNPQKVSRAFLTLSFVDRPSIMGNCMVFERSSHPRADSRTWADLHVPCRGWKWRDAASTVCCGFQAVERFRHNFVNFFRLQPPSSLTEKQNM